MADTAIARAPPPLCSLPDEITIWEILVRLPPKALLRCRAVCPAWRRATSTRDFLLAHHARQPTRPLLCGYNFVDDQVQSLDIIPFDHRAAYQLRLQSVARLEQASDIHRLEACCDGLLLLSFYKTSIRDWRLSICNPATRQYAPLRLPYGSSVEYSLLGMYPHSPTGDYRLLLYRASRLMHDEMVPDAQDGSYVFTLGSDQPPRHIGYIDAEELTHTFGSVLFHGSLHWYTQYSIRIMVFDTTAELFRQMCSPLVLVRTNLFEMDGMLCMSSFNDAATTIDIWMAQDYETEVWACKYRVALPVAELTVRFGKFDKSSWVVAVPWDGDVLLLVNFGEWLLQIDIDGKLVATFHSSGLSPANLWLKQTLVQHTFFPTLEGYVVNSSPFI